VLEYIHCNKYQNVNKIPTNRFVAINSLAFLSVVLITEMLEICIQASYDQNVQLILKSYLPVVYGTPLKSDSTQKIGKPNPLKFFASTKTKEETKVSRTAAIPVGGDP